MSTQGNFSWRSFLGGIAWIAVPLLIIFALGGHLMCGSSQQQVKTVSGQKSISVETFPERDTKQNLVGEGNFSPSVNALAGVGIAFLIGWQAKKMFSSK